MYRPIHCTREQICTLPYPVPFFSSFFFFFGPLVLPTSPDPLLPRLSLVPLVGWYFPYSSPRPRPHAVPIAPFLHSPPVRPSIILRLLPHYLSRSFLHLPLSSFLLTRRVSARIYPTLKASCLLLIFPSPILGSRRVGIALPRLP